jgi:ribose transport system ATP-binding protein
MNPGELPAPDSVIALAGVWKSYGSLSVLKDVSIDLRQGQVHMLLGENGAGKSTLVGLMVGAHAADAGSLYLRGKKIVGLKPAEARRAGINAVMQDFSLAPSMTVAENYFLGREETRGVFLRKREMRSHVAGVFADLNVRLDVDAQVEKLSRPEQQLLEILRALGGKPGAIILDEPTATLTHEETELLFTIVRRLRREGWAILYITHRFEEVRALGDCITVLRDGQRVAHYLVEGLSDERLIRDMVGRPLESFYPDIAAEPGETALSLVGIASREGGLREASLHVRAGEIVGLGGLIGSGKGHVGQAAFGLLSLDAGHVEVFGERREFSGPREALTYGIVYLPQDRRGEALALNRPAHENISLEMIRAPAGATRGFLRKRWLRSEVERLMQILDVRPKSSATEAQRFSGGNQQKLVVARALSRPRHIYIFCEPTAGIDVGTRLELYRQLVTLCREGAAVLLITSDLQELVHLSHRIYVMREGRTVGELCGEARTEEEVTRLSFGLSSAPERLREAPP